MAAALGLREEDLELSMGMSADYEQAVCTRTLDPLLPPPALPACHPAAHLRIVCLSMGMSADFERALRTYSLACHGRSCHWAASPGGVKRCWGVQHIQSYSGGLFVSTTCVFLQQYKIATRLEQFGHVSCSDLQAGVFRSQVELGSSNVRVGSTIFGARDYSKAA